MGGHTEYMNWKYDLDEMEWPVTFHFSDYTIMVMFSTRGEYGPFRDETEHEHQQMLFALWHEIETRGLVQPDDPPMGTLSWEWERQTKGWYNWADPRNPANESMAEDIAYGTRGSRWNIGSKGRKVSKGYIEDEENLGIYRRHDG
jgi:hypothetical protein